MEMCRYLLGFIRFILGLVGSVILTFFSSSDFTELSFVSESVFFKLLWLLTLHSTVLGFGLARIILKLFLLPEKLKLSTRVILWSLGLEVDNLLGSDMAV